MYFFNISGSDGAESERLRSKKLELEESVAALQESLKSIQTELRLLEDEQANLQKERVCWKQNKLQKSLLVFTCPCLYILIVNMHLIFLVGVV